VYKIDSTGVPLHALPNGEA